MAAFRCTTTTPPIALRQRGAEGSLAQLLWPRLNRPGQRQQCSVGEGRPVLSGGWIEDFPAGSLQLKRPNGEGHECQLRIGSPSARTVAPNRSALLGPIAGAARGQCPRAAVSEEARERQPDSCPPPV